MKPIITIVYCPRCGWLLRAAYMAQEILTTFASDVKGVFLQPADVSGQFTICVDEQSIFDRKEMARFPDVKELKQLIRDKVNPGKHLGHSDKKKDV